MGEFNVKCVDNTYNASKRLVQGAEYRVVYETKDYYYIRIPGEAADSGWERHRFIRVETETTPDIKTELLETAGNIVNGARRGAYGTPEDNFGRIARFWQAYFDNTGRGEIEITAQDVSPLMRLMKEARLCESPNHKDSFVDIIGYTLTGAEVNSVE